MLFNLIGVVVTGVAVAGAILLFFRTIGKRPPSWLLPIAAGSAMFIFHLWNEYTWFDRVTARLPDHVVVAESYSYESLLQPWTLLQPRINRFAAVDRSSIRQNGRAPGYVMADVLLVGRLDPAAKVTQLYDCEKERHTGIGASTRVDERGLPIEATWIKTGRDQVLFRLICEEGDGG